MQLFIRKDSIIDIKVELNLSFCGVFCHILGYIAIKWIVNLWLEKTLILKDLFSVLNSFLIANKSVYDVLIDFFR